MLLDAFLEFYGWIDLDETRLCGAIAHEIHIKERLECDHFAKNLFRAEGS
ncbi:unnamed protein product [Haemonchus placei]|uniref:DNA primase n=1 Tax=Haemonchus placei TaxID=6290 RepID=A0A0N4WNJ8_HAEPC|nr:unnamed protein product [Haemonchus placei]